MDFEKIIGVYKTTNSTKKTAAELNISEVKVRRVLITCGLWRSKTSDMIGELYKKGLSVKQIAEQLYMTEKNVQAYLPYTRGVYGGEEKSSDAIRSEEYRLRRKTSLENQVVRAKQAKKEIPAESQDIERGKTMDGSVNVLKLRLELSLDEPSPEEWNILKKYGKIENGISREVLVPDTMTLHALHYVIQKAFGWQNSHLHHFALPDDTFEMCTGGMFDRWCSLCGVYFRFPTDDLDDLYWDDDFDGRVSINSWLKKKYCGPYRYEGTAERHVESQLAVKDFYKRFKMIEVHRPWDFWSENKEPLIEKVISPKDGTIDEVFRSLVFDSGANTLLERLTLKEILCTGDKKLATIDLCSVTACPVTDRLVYEYDYGDGWVVHIALIKDTEATEDQNARVKALKPVCVARDGINVLDDVGGVHGFCDFLEELHEGDLEEKDELRQWSKIFGWTGRFVKPENIL